MIDRRADYERCSSGACSRWCARSSRSLPGARRLPLAQFTALTALGCALWAAAFVLIGLVSGSAYAAVGSVASKLGLGLVAALLAFAVVRKRRR